MLCSYGRHLCSRERLSGFDFCSVHILEDKSAPFKQCSFHIRTPLAAQSSASLAPAGQSVVARRCTRPASKADKKDGYCLDHSRKALIVRQRGLGRKRPGSTAQRYLEDLDHYKKERFEEEVDVEGEESEEDEIIDVVKTEAASAGGAATATAPNATDAVKKEEDKEAKRPVKKEKRKKIKKKDVLDVLSQSIPSISQRALESADDCNERNFATSEDEDDTVETSWRGDGDSDADSVDSDLEDPLKHAGAYTAEEVIRLMRDKLIRLQKLYIDQFGRLKHQLREDRRKYCQRLRREKEEQLISIHSQPKDSHDEWDAYEEVKALAHYTRPQGVEAVLHAQLMEKRIRASEGDNFKPPSVAKCNHSLTTSTKCGETCMPMSRYCFKHILEDDKQILFRACHFSTEADGPCETPIPDVLEGATCVYHTQVPEVFEEKAEVKEESEPQKVKSEPPQAVEVVSNEKK